MSYSKKNHYVPRWYQKRFLSSESARLFYMNLDHLEKHGYSPPLVSIENCFIEKDLYTTFFLGSPNDEIERKLFGTIDHPGPQVLDALVSNDLDALHQYLERFFELLDAQKIRTPKGLAWIKNQYPQIENYDLLIEMQKLRTMHCTMWGECIREIVSAENSSVKFIITDHPVTVYNSACPRNSEYCKYPNDPSISLKGSQTIFPLGSNYCLILTNLEFGRDPQHCDRLSTRTNARHFGSSVIDIRKMIRGRSLNNEDVIKINYILKKSARRFIAAEKRKWLYQEPRDTQWASVGSILIPPKDKLSGFGGQIYLGYSDGGSAYFDEFGRTTKKREILKKPVNEVLEDHTQECPCGYGRAYLSCCKDRPIEYRPSWSEYSFRERNLMFLGAIKDILGLNRGKNWNDIRAELNDEHVRNIHGIYGDLFPPDTDFVSLLPKPDKNTFRMIYSGIIDPRVAPLNITNMLLYADEIFMISPFLNYHVVSKEFSPVINPSQYKENTIKNLLTFLSLHKHIQDGKVQIIPSPYDFNHSLQDQINEEAKNRQKNFKFDLKKSKIMTRLMEEDVLRSRFYLSEDKIKQDFLKFNPNFTESNLKELINEHRHRHQADPIALLQTNIGTQIIMSHLTPNLELGLFLAQIIGASIFTDNQYRWDEITSSYKNTDSSDIVQKNEILEIGFEDSVDSQPQAKWESFQDIRILLRESFWKKQEESLQDLNVVDQINKKLVDIQNLINLKFQSDSTIKKRPLKIAFSNGAHMLSIYRLLLIYGGNFYLKNMPMVMFLEEE
ncbi:MAG: DUF4238 domain-containing protein [Chlamydiae bacterium]|nr:DUF4238 domain-containing protein [Chlamydiota bacterium]